MENLSDNMFYMDRVFDLDYKNELELIYTTVVGGIKKYFVQNGLKRAVLGLSGGLDSTICAVLLADALGVDNVYGISMAYRITTEESKSHAKQLAENLGIHFIEHPVVKLVDSFKSEFSDIFSSVEKDWGCRLGESYTNDNIQARVRAMILFGVSNEFEACIPIATSDKSETYVGYATVNGDMSGGYAPIAGVTKTQLFALAKWLNNNREKKNVIPQEIIEKKPGAELAIDPKTNKPLLAEDALMPYPFLDEIIFKLEVESKTQEEILSDEFLYEKSHNISQEQKSAWINKFFKRMKNSQFKRALMPPYPIVSENNV